MNKKIFQHAFRIGITSITFTLTSVLAEPTVTNHHLNSASLNVDSAAIQVSETSIQPKAFGNDGQYTVIHASRWLPWSATPTPEYRGNGYVGPGQLGYSAYWTQMDLPNGAMVDFVYAIVYDTDSTGGWFFDVHGYEGAIRGPASYTSFGSDSTSGAPGYTTIAISLISTPIIVREGADMDGDGIGNPNSFNLSLEGYQSDNASSLRFWGAGIHWKRTISPAPTNASFTDVPTNHWAFQQIEALASSKITSGCGGSNFCPNDPVTRAQMAVFLAKALGLHWPE